MMPSLFEALIMFYLLVDASISLSVIIMLRQVLARLAAHDANVLNFQRAILAARLTKRATFKSSPDRPIPDTEERPREP